MANPPVIRPARASDEARWRELFDAYTRFYERQPVAAITSHTWARILDDSPVHSGFLRYTLRLPL